MRETRARHRGFFFLDAVVGLFLIGVFAVALAVASDRARRTDQRMGDARAATRAAERVLTAIAAGASLPSADPGALLVTRVDSGDVRSWVRVEASVNGRGVVLYGLVPTAAADRAVTAYPGRGGGR